MHKGIKDNDYIKDETGRGLINFIKDVALCGEKSYNLTTEITKLTWFIGGDTTKIRKLQKMLNQQGDCQVLEEDGVYGPLTEKAWVEHIDKLKNIYDRNIVLSGSKAWIKNFDTLLQLSEQGELESASDDENNWVVGVNLNSSLNLLAGGGKGRTIYIDDEFNIAIMDNYALKASTDIGISRGVTFEWSTTANTVSDMEGWSTTYEGGIDIPILKVPIGLLGLSATSGISGRYTVSTSNNSITSKYITPGASIGYTSASVAGGVSYNVPILEFNPKVWMRNCLGIN